MIIVFFLFIVICLLIDFKKTVIVFTPFKFMIMGGVVLFGSVTFDNAVSLIISFLFIVKYSKYKDITKRSWPLTLPFLIMAISESISAMIGTPNYISIPLKVCRNYAYCFVLYHIVKNSKDFSLLIKSMSIFIILLVGNGIVEFISDINVIGDWISQYLKETAFFIDTSDYGTRGTRVHSFLAHSICFGNVCAIFLFVMLTLKFSYYKFRLQNLIIVLLIIGIILSNSRTPYLACFVYIIPFISIYKKLNVTRRFGLCILGIILIWYLAGPISTMMDSMFNENTEHDTGGSNMTMRLEQLAASFWIIRNNLLFGLGYSFDFRIYDELRGAESIWFNLLMNGGWFAVTSYFIIFLVCFFKAKTFILNKYIRFMTLGYILQQTATYNAGLNEFLFYFCLIILICYEHIFLVKSKIYGNN